MRKIKNILLYIDSEKSVCNFWRGTGVFNELERDGYIKTKIADWKESLITLRKYDIAYFQRPMFEHCLQQVLMAKDCGLKIWIDLDDWMSIPDNYPIKRQYDSLFDLKAFKTILKAADIISVTNEKMKEAYFRFNTNITIIPNAINDRVFKQNKQSTNNIIVWRGGPNHINDILSEINSIKSILYKYPYWHFITIGERIQEFEGIKNHQYINRLSMHDYFGFMLRLNPAIVIAPLEKNKFTELKSNIVWQEATIAGAVCITPDFSTCTEGIIYTTSMKDQIEKIIRNRPLIDENFKTSVKVLEKNYYLSKVNKLRLKIIKSL